MATPEPQTAFCLRCGYDLLGLPAEGACPECGQRYDKFSRMGIASYAAKQQEQGDRIALYAKVGILALLGLAALALGGLAGWSSGDWFQPVLIAGTVGGGLFLMAGLVWLVEFLEQRQR